MNLFRIGLAAIVLVFFTACGSAAEAHNQREEFYALDPESAADLAQYHRASLWASRAQNSLPWTRAVVQVVTARMGDLNRARDKEIFCPGYAGASAAERTVCWLRLVGGIVEFESSFNPGEPPFHEGGGNYSVGLMALSVGECPNAPTVRSLQNPVQNLICGVNRLARLIARGGSIENPDNRGASAYWSTLRPAHKRWDPARKKWLNLGKKALIIQRTRTFRNY